MSFDLGKLFIEWRRIVPNGVPNPGNAYHLVLLKEICMAKGIDRNIIDNVILTLEKKEIDPDTKVKYKIKDPKTVADTQSNIENFVKRFLDKEGNIGDPAGYHKALYAAMNADKLASHFYEQGKADGVQDMIKQSKNPSTDAPRQVASGDVYVGGFKVKAISGADSSKLKIKKRTFNN